MSDAAPQYKAAGGWPLPFEEGKHYTYSDYCTWGEDCDNGPDYKVIKDRYELYEGIPMVMDAPNRRHQEVIGELFAILHNFLKDKPCKVYVTPFDVRFNPDGADDTVLQPDILIICDHSKLTYKGCDGAPDMTIEILSPGSAQRDRLRKLRIYEQYGVREYWIVDPETNMVAVHILENGKYFIKAYSGTDVIPVGILEGCEIDMAAVFSAGEQV